MLVDIIKKFVKAKLEQLISDPDAEQRIIFSGPADFILKDLFELFSNEGDQSNIEINGTQLSFPVFLVDSKAKPIDEVKTSRSTANSVVSVRNSSQHPTFVAIVPNAESLNLSIESTVTEIGYDVRQLKDFDTWKNHELISFITKDLIGAFEHKSEEQAVQMDEVLKICLKEIWENNSEKLEKKEIWRVLNSLSEVVKNGNEDQFLAVLGIPYGTNLEKIEIALEYVDKVAKLFNDLNFRGSEEYIKENIDDERLINSVQDFCQHIRSKCRWPKDFSDNPLHKYSPKIFQLDENKDLPNWWYDLTLPVWQRVFSVAPSDGRDALQIELLNQLTTPKGIMPSSISGAQFQFKFKDAENQEINKNKQLSISRSVGNKALEFLETITISGEDKTWQDNDPPIHDRYLRYVFEASNIAPHKFPTISLASYQPGVLLNCYNAEKVTPFKWMPNGIAPEDRQKRPQFECDLHLHSTGVHTIHFYLNTTVDLKLDVQGFEVDNEGGSENTTFIKEDETTYSVRIITDDECKYQFSALDQESGDLIWYVINITAGDNEPKGVRSEFERLVFENVDNSSGRSPQIISDQSLLSQYFDWSLSTKSSFYPVIFGDDIATSWKKPTWEQMDTVSAYKTQADPRPSISEFSPPEALISCRSKLQDILLAHCETKEKAVTIIEFSKLSKDEDFKKNLENYVYEYENWLQEDYDLAIWFDVITFHKKTFNGSALLDEPTALFLSPLHPIKLAWQVNAQVILSEGLAVGTPCPAASQIRGDHFPRCVSLTTKTALSQPKNVGYFSVGSSNDYWSVLWNTNQTDDLGNNQILQIFNADIGLQLDGLTTGFTSSQMTQSLDEMLLQSPSKTHFKMIVASGTSSESDCTQGILDWCEVNLGKEVDEWSTASPTRLEIFDKRHLSQVPEPSLLAELTKKCDATVSWNTIFSKQVQPETSLRADLAVLAHISATNTSFDVRDQVYRSGIDKSLTFRYDLKSPASSELLTTVAKSIIGQYLETKDQTSLQRSLIKPMRLLEEKCAAFFDYMSFSPDTVELTSALENAEFCAVSSASLDQTCFANLRDKSYLWHYELPKYSRNVTDNSGYFLMANESGRMLVAISDALKLLSPDKNYDDDVLSSILNEISMRGIPTLKNLTAGGTNAFGEVGLLAAVKHLQWSLARDTKGLVPVEGKGKEAINLIIPSDIFHKRYDKLRQFLRTSQSNQRPDLIIASISFDQYEEPIALKITPIEVKTSDKSFPQSKEQSALKQASEFAKFLNLLKSESEKVEIWSLAWRDLIASWVEYGFKIIGQKEAIIKDSDWLKRQTATITKILSGMLPIYIDDNGRLISISDRGTSGSKITDFALTLTKEDAAKVFASEIPSHVITLSERDDPNWNFEVDESHLGEIPLAVSPTEQPPNEDDTTQTGQSGPAIVADPEDAEQTPEPTETTEGSGPAEDEEPESEQPETHDNESTGIKFNVGYSLDDISQKKIDFFPSNTRLNNLNMGIVGDMGMGKTQLTKALIYNLVKDPTQNRGRKPNFLILDYKKDYSKDDNFIKKTGAKVYAPKNLPLNPFSTHGTDTDWLGRALFFNDLLEKIQPKIGPVQRELVKGAIREAFKGKLDNSDPTIVEIFERYQEKVNGKIDTAFSIMSDFIDGQHFETDQSKFIPFNKFLDGVVVIDLNQLGQNDQAKNMIVALFLNLFYEYMLKIEKQPFLGSEPSLRFIDSFLLVDEADKIMKYDFPILRSLLSEGREFGVGVILASQYLSHFKTSGSKGMDYKEPLLTWFLHKVPNINDRELSELGIQNEYLADRIPQLELHECLCKTLDCPGELIHGTPFYKLD